MKKLIFSLLIFPTLSFAAFNDVEFNHPYYDAINYLQAEGIVEGYSDGTFKPENQINRAEFTKIVLETQFKNDIQPCPNELPFSDINFSDWYSGIVCSAKSLGIVDGYPDKSFQASNNILMTEASKIIGQSFALTIDKSLEPWYAPYMMRLTDLNAIPPSLTQPDQALNRGEMAELIYRLATDKVDKSASQLIFLTSDEEYAPENFDADQKDTMLTLVNQARAKVDVEPLTVNPTLSEVAQAFAQKMDDEDFFSHLDLNGNSAADRVRDAGYKYRFVAENIAKGQVTAQFAFDNWKDSPGHWANIIDSKYEETGFGQYKVTDDNFYKGYFWVQVFGTKQ
ncbi:hypothetical protein GW756_03140 [bacterium]|nr:hypothetical protein [bacterium]NCQ55486.1 hypothetical protein [Candidatus Parcubacteria bacterium]NCS67496.1 hypothetical protein [Candidatus Peregrinibacteria bacterium]NCS96338.1 hypothetical protein [bacterium]